MSPIFHTEGNPEKDPLCCILPMKNDEYASPLQTADNCLELLPPDEERISTWESSLEEMKTTNPQDDYLKTLRLFKKLRSPS